MNATTRAAAVRVRSPGGPEAMALEAVEVGPPGPGEVRLRQTAVGVNYIDVYHRSGAYALPLPAGLGVEGAGVVDAVGEGVADLRPGERVAYAGGPPGAYAEARLFPAGRLVPVPEGVSDEQAAAVLFKGITAQYLLRSTYPVGPGTSILLHASAGGLGLLVAAWARHLGATVVGVVSSPAKAERALAAGCAHALVWGRDDVAAQARALTGGRGVDVAYDSAGADTWAASLDALRPRGLMVSLGAASGPVPPVDLAALGGARSLFLTRPSIAAHTADPAEYRQRAAEVFAALRAGTIGANVWRRYPLAAAGEAHADLEGRRTSGSLLLLPGADDFRRRLPRFAPGSLERNEALAARLRGMAAERGCTPAQLALAWLLHQAGVAVIPGTRTPSRMAENAAAASIALAPSELEEIAAAMDPGQVAGARYGQATALPAV